MGLVLLLISFLAFAASFLAQGDPVEMYYIARDKPIPSEEILKKERVEAGLDKPVIIQYKNWLFDFLSGDMGTSYKDDLPVAFKIKTALPKTLKLALPAFILTFILAIALSISCLYLKDSSFDKIIGILTFVLASIPSFVYGVILLIVFAVKLRLFPVISKGNPDGWVLPSIALALPMVGKYTRQIRAAMVSESQSPYVSCLRLRGVNKHFIIIGNIFKNTLGLVFNLGAMAMGYLMGGVTIVENLFVWPGLGRLIMEAILFRDYPTIQAFVFLSASVFFILNLLADILHRLVDRRLDET